jgi:hypothetical protein
MDCRQSKASRNLCLYSCNTYLLSSEAPDSPNLVPRPPAKPVSLRINRVVPGGREVGSQLPPSGGLKMPH